jgi:GH25 family lysozyme M1 (1,4-beta-N-acetylmuramidase)
MTTHASYRNPLVYDIAYNNDIFDWSKVFPQPAGVICKATEWNEDSTFANNWQGLAQRGIPRMAYHFMHFNVPTYSSGAQARDFCNAIKKRGGIRSNDYFICDAEEKDAHGNSLVSIGQIIDWCYNVTVLLGVGYDRIIIYSTKDILDNLSMAKMSATQLAIIRGIRIWIAGYPEDVHNNSTADNYANPSAAGFIPDQSIYGQVVLWQYDSEVPNTFGIPGGLDPDWVDAKFMEEWSAGGVPQPPVPTPTPLPVPVPTAPTITSITLHYSDHTVREIPA